MSDWYQLAAAEVLARLGSDASWGLSTVEANHRLEKYGVNELIEPGLKQPWQILWAQLTETLVIILIVAAVISAILGDYKDGLGIIAIIILISVLGFSQEYRAQKAIANLKKLAVPNAKVRRDGTVQEISARHLLPGDIVLLEAEDIVPADGRLLSVAEVSSNFQRQRMTTIHQFPKALGEISCALETVWHWHREISETAAYIAFSKGRVKNLLDVSSQVWVDGQAEELNDIWQEKILTTYHQLIQNGLRVLGLSFRLLRSPDVSEIDQDLIFVGLVGMNDPARPEVKDAVLLCQQAGIRPVMITGDHPLTARYIAHEVEIDTGERILTSDDFSHISLEALATLVEEVSVYARITPKHKFNIVQFLQRQGHIVAMTGDGANDAPALKKADIGVAMGISGTDVAKEAADMVLLDDNFATIVAAVKEGRIIYDNIRKFIKYLLSSNVGELWVMLLAPFLGMPLPLLPLQILWVNITTDGLPALALGVEPAERNTMNRPPYPPNENILGRGMGRDIISIGLLMSLVSLITGYWYWHSGNPGWQTILFTTITLSQMGNALAIRSERDSLWQIGLLSNKPILAAVTLTLVLQLAVIYLPVLQNIFTTIPLSFGDLAVSLILSTVVFWCVELKKWLVRQRS